MFIVEVCRMKRLLARYSWLLLGALLLAAQTSPDVTDVTVESLPFVSDQAVCTGAFVALDLNHTSTVPGGDRVRMFEANGGGVGINDLDNYGDVDIVLANHADSNTIPWNEGQLNFRAERMLHGDSRAITLVDVDA